MPRADQEMFVSLQTSTIGYTKNHDASPSTFNNVPLIIVAEPMTAWISKSVDIPIHNGRRLKVIAVAVSNHKQSLCCEIKFSNHNSVKNNQKLVYFFGNYNRIMQVGDKVKEKQ